MLLFLILFSSFINVIISTVSDEEYASIPDLFYYEDFDKCMLYGNKSIYCSFSLQVNPISTDENGKIWRTIKEISSNPRYYRHDWLRHGICLNNVYPNASDEILTNRIIDFYDKKWSTSGLKFSMKQLKCQNVNFSHPILWSDIFIACIFLSYIIFVLAATFYDEYCEAHLKNCGTNKHKSNSILAAFSITKNWKRLKTIKNNSNPHLDKLKCIQGIRFYNIICVILAHTVMISLTMPVLNPLFTETITHKTLSMFLANGGYIVQTFFVISGWLITYQIQENFDANNNNFQINHCIMILFNRILRITPTLLVMVAINTSWLIHFGNGPFWDQIVGVEYRRCRQNWWTNILYVNNYVHKEEMCLQQTWYIAADTQLYVIGLIINWLLVKYPKWFRMILGTNLIIALIIPFFISYLYDFDIVVRQYPEPLYDTLLKVPEWHIMYTSILTNYGGFMIGIIFGYLFFTIKNKEIKITKWRIIAWWLLTYGLCIFIILIASIAYQDDYVPNRLTSALYWASGRNLFAFGIAVGIYGLTLKIGGFTKWCCEWKPAVILGRLSFSAYLVHVTLIKIMRGSQRSPFYLSIEQIFINALSDIVIAFMGATILCLLIELPMSALQKIYILRKKWRL